MLRAFLNTGVASVSPPGHTPRRASSPARASRLARNRAARDGGRARSRRGVRLRDGPSGAPQMGREHGAVESVGRPRGRRVRVPPLAPAASRARGVPQVRSHAGQEARAGEQAAAARRVRAGHLRPSRVHRDPSNEGAQAVPRVAPAGPRARPELQLQRVARGRLRGARIGARGRVRRGRRRTRPGAAETERREEALHRRDAQGLRQRSHAQRAGRRGERGRGRRGQGGRVPAALES